jgi:hypothetical protein
VIPQLRGWDEKYRAAGLTIVGVHSPEFLWEKPYDKVARAAQRWGGRYWPTTWLVDRQGVVRYRHIGEGAYDETEGLIQTLLKEGR